MLFNDMRNPENVEELIADIAAKFYAAHDLGCDEYNEAIVDLHQDGFLNLPSSDTGIPVSSLALKTLSPQELTPYLNQKVGLTSLSGEHKKFVLNTCEKTSWKQAESIVDEIASQGKMSQSI